MRLIRLVDFPDSKKAIHRGPVPGGTFWALDGVHDLPVFGHRVAYADALFLMKHGTLYIQDVRQPDTWHIVSDLAALRVFHVTYATTCDGDDYPVFWPYLPELYYVPRTFRGGRSIARVQRRARSIPS
ncbi:hypothetical protein [Sulfobacillus thermosulfidooxidans]|uniref:hypothetical protein n=1 Tax=Sulfobacillus thermosulfidooxidans TaxID=28034 RepID=UPI0006B667BD|nr:hypothetical protein [Sulfobacillus thermosulfidooxidans]